MERVIGLQRLCYAEGIETFNWTIREDFEQGDSDGLAFKSKLHRCLIDATVGTDARRIDRGYSPPLSLCMYNHVLMYCYDVVKGMFLVG